MSLSGHLGAVAELDLEIDVPGRSPVRGRLRGSGTELELEVSDPAVFPGACDATAIRSMADALARRRLTVHVVHAGVRLVSLGAVRAPWWQRRTTGSRHIRLGGPTKADDGQPRELRAVRPRTIPMKAWTRSSSLSTSHASPTVVPGRSLTGR
jgi:hypothetical protein